MKSTKLICTDDSLRYVYDRKRLKAKKRFLYSCAEHSILPQKTETLSQNLHRSFFRNAKAGETHPKFPESEFHSTKV